jgi:D-xylose 1-dehydrogenase (NADP+, D-xylono-1,5-lactone-forming)
MRWGILGPGRISRAFLRGLVVAGTGEAVAVGSRDLDRARAVAAEFGVRSAYGSYAALLRDAEVDAVYIGLPNGLHAEWTAAAAAAGKHVLCEKPLGATGPETDTMFDLAARHGVLLVEAFMYRFHPRTRALAELVGGGTIGALREIRAGFGFPCDPTDARFTDGVAGGAMRDVGCYPVNLSRLLAGPPVAASGFARWAPSGADAALTGTLEYADGVHAAVAGALDTAHQQGVHVIGESGDLFLPEPFIQPSRDPARIVLRRQGMDGPTEELAFGLVDQYAAEADGFAAMAGGAPNDTMPAEQSRQNAATIDALLASAAAGGARVTIGA